MLFSCCMFDTLINCHFYKEAWTSSLCYYAAALDCHLRVTSKKLTLLAYMTVARTGIYTSAWAPLLAICVDWKLSRFSASDNRVFDAHLLYVCNMLKNWHTSTANLQRIYQTLVNNGCIFYFDFLIIIISLTCFWTTRLLNIVNIYTMI